MKPENNTEGITWQQAVTVIQNICESAESCDTCPMLDWCHWNIPGSFVMPCIWTIPEVKP